MPDYCCVYGCNSTRGKSSEKLSFHHFPRREKYQHRHELWLSKINRKDFRPSKMTVVCSKHFEESDFEGSLLRESLLPTQKWTRKLKNSAVPTLHLKGEKDEYPNSSATVGGGMLNSQAEYEQCAIKYEEETLGFTEIKTEPQSIKTEIKIEPEECDNFLDKEHEVNYVKCEMEAITDPVASTRNILEVVNIQESFEQDYVNKQQDQQSNTEDETYIVSEPGSSEVYERDLEGKKCDTCVYDDTVVKSYTYNVCDHGKLISNCRTTKKCYICDICKKSFSHRSNIMKHMQNHMGLKPLRCNICNKAYSFKSLLNKHMHAHTGQGPYVCSICSKRFSCKTDLSRHMYIHTGDKPFSCKYCSKKFCIKYGRDKHMLIHTTKGCLMCNICNRSFVYKTSLAKHMYVHSGEKPFACNLCSKTFSEKFQCVKHMNAHACQKNFTCSLCNKTFPKKLRLTKHMHTHGIDTLQM